MVGLLEICLKVLVVCTWLASRVIRIILGNNSSSHWLLWEIGYQGECYIGPRININDFVWESTKGGNDKGPFSFSTGASIQKFSF